MCNRWLDSSTYCPHYSCSQSNLIFSGNDYSFHVDVVQLPNRGHRWNFFCDFWSNGAVMNWINLTFGSSRKSKTLFKLLRPNDALDISGFWKWNLRLLFFYISLTFWVFVLFWKLSCAEFWIIWILLCCCKHTQVGSSLH